MWLPVAQRELLAASRKPVLFWLRAAAPLLGVLFVFLAGSGLASEPPAQQGRTIFISIALGLFLYSVCAGLYFTSESITSERRDGTLPLLQVTGMRELDLVLGKLLGHSLPGISGLLAVVPILSLPVVLGGVTALDLLRVALILVGTLCLSLTVAVAASSATHSSTEALKHSIFNTLAILTAGVFAYGYVRRGAKRIAREEHTANAAVLLVMGIFIWGFGLPTGSPAIMLLGVLAPFERLLGAYSFPIECLLLAAILVYVLRSAKPFSDPEIQPFPAEPPHLHRLRARFRRLDPIGDRLAHTPLDFEFALCFGILAGFLQFILCLRLYSGGNTDFSIVMWLSFAAVVALYFILARRAASFLVESRRNGMLEVLFVTPVSWGEWLRVHRIAFLRLAWRPVGILMAGEVIGHSLALRFAGFPDRFEFGFWFLSLTVAGYVCSVFATLWFAVLRALSSKNATTAAIWTVLVVIVLPGTSLLFLGDMPNFIPARYFQVVFSTGLFLLVHSIVWFGARVYLNSLSGNSPAAILGMERRPGKKAALSRACQIDASIDSANAVTVSAGRSSSSVR